MTTQEGSKYDRVEQSWDDFPEYGQGSRSEPPVIKRGDYRVRVAHASAPMLGQNFEGDGQETTFVVEFAVPDALPEGPTLRKTFRLSDYYRRSGIIKDNSSLFEVMTALGFEPKKPGCRVRPTEWVGLECIAAIRPGEVQEDGMPGWPRITELLPLDTDRPAESPAVTWAEPPPLSQPQPEVTPLVVLPPITYGRAQLTLDQVIDGVRGKLGASGSAQILMYYGLGKGASNRVIRQHMMDSLSALPPDTEPVRWLAGDIAEGAAPFE